jgi:hypothetical protein
LQTSTLSKPAIVMNQQLVNKVNYARAAIRPATDNQLANWSTATPNLGRQILVKKRL